MIDRLLIRTGHLLSQQNKYKINNATLHHQTEKS